MGFQVKTYKLVWPEESIWHGLEVRMRGQTIGELEDISKLSGAKGIEAVKPVLDILSEALLSWNLENEDGTPIPVSEFRSQDSTMLLAIVNAWTGVVGDVPAPLSTISSDGEKSEEASIPMVVPSESHPNLNTPN